MLGRRPIYVLDAGHGGFSPCQGSSPNRAAAYGLEEKELALDLAKRVQALLAPHADVQLTRYTDVNLALAERARIARAAGADAFVSLHFNGSDDPRANETNAWIASSANPGSRDLAARLAETVGRAAGARAWGVGTRDLGVLLTSRHDKRTRACLLEIAHLSNPDQASRLQDSAYRNHLARAIAGALGDLVSGFTAKALGDLSKEEVLAKLRDCGLVPSTVKTMPDYESKVLKKSKVFGLDVTLHSDFLAKVKAAESALGATPHGVTNVTSYRPGSSTYHGWGLAIDLNPGENPYVMHESGEAALDAKLGPVYQRIAWLMNGQESLIPAKLGTLVPPKHTVSSAYLLLQAESAMIPVYFALLKSADPDLQKFIDTKTGFDWKNVWGKAAAPAVADLRSLIEADYKVLHDPPSAPGSDQPFKHIDPKKKGFLNLSLALVTAMKAQNLRWGAIDLFGASGDMMHFDDGLSPLGKFIYSAKKGDSSSCPANSKASSVTLQAAGTPAGLRTYILNPAGEANAGLAAALRLLDRYKPKVDPSKVSFRVTPKKKSRLGDKLSEDGHSFWDGATPAIFLLQDAYDAVAARVAGAGNTVAVHGVIRTIGHELHHLWREKIDRTASNPIDPVYRREADRRLEEVRQNWLDQVKNNPQIRREMRIPASVTVTKWTDIPAAERDKIEKDASDTDYIQGLHDKSTYLVEEMYTRIEEIAFLRVQQKLGSAGDIADSRTQLTEMAKMIYFLNNVLHSVADKGALVTPELLAKTEKAMPAYLRGRYPNKEDNKLDSYSVIFFLSASERGLPPLFDDTGKLISKAPTGARVP